MVVQFGENSLIFPPNRALLQQIEICKQDGPSRHDLRLLRGWLVSADGNDCSLEGPGWDAWIGDEGSSGDQDSENDYVVLSSKHGNRDRFERWAGDSLLGLYHRLVGRHFKVRSQCSSHSVC